MEKVMSKKDVIVCRGIWYVMTLVSIFGLCISLNLIWPPGGKPWSRFLRDGAVSATTFYAVTLLRYLFFSDPPSPCYRVFALEERSPQIFFTSTSLSVVMSGPLHYTMIMKVFAVSVSLFTISLFTGAIGLIQLSGKLRMEIRHALLTLFLGWLFCLCGIYICSSYVPDTQPWAYVIGFLCQLMLAVRFTNYSRHKGVDSDT